MEATKSHQSRRKRHEHSHKKSHKKRSTRVERKKKNRKDTEEKSPLLKSEEENTLKIFEKECLCTICLNIVFRPVTTSCGHNFCQSCLQKWLKNKSQCPNCKTSLTDWMKSNRTYGITAYGTTNLQINLGLENLM